MPQIPCQPIGYDDAKLILSHLEGKAAPEDFRGKISGIPYTIGGAFNQTSCPGCVGEIVVNTRKERAVSPDVVGIIEGAIEPDR